jgi:heat shock protein HtpX
VPHLLDETARTEHKQRNRRQSVTLLAGLGAVLGISAMLIWGWFGLVWAALAVAVILLFAPRVPPETMMRLYRAREIDPRMAGQLGYVLAKLTERAELPVRPRLYVIPSHTLNAFATGSLHAPTIAVTEGLLRTLSLRELAGVLAHEISHIRNNDLWVMGLADAMSRFTQALSTLAMVLAFFNLLGMMAGVIFVSWGAIFILYLAPMISSLLQLGLSRAREYDADLEGAQLTGDPEGLVSALRKLERSTGNFWEDLFPMPGRRIPGPSLLRSHPLTEDRVARLRELEGLPKPPPVVRSEDVVAIPIRHQILLSPRRHWSGIWY